MGDGGAEGAAGAAASGAVGSRGLLTGGGFGGQNSPVVTVHGLYSEVQVRPYLGPVENPHPAPTPPLPPHPSSRILSRYINHSPRPDLTVMLSPPPRVSLLAAVNRTSPAWP